MMLRLVCAVALACVVAAQGASNKRPSPQRKGAIVTVLDADGERAAGVAVVCFGAPWFAEFEQAPDFVRARTDARGRTTLALLAGRNYSISAVLSVGKERVASCVREGVLVAGGSLTVKLQTACTMQPRLMPLLSKEYARALDDGVLVDPLPGLDAWQSLAPLQVQYSPTSSGGFFVPSHESPPAPFVRVRVLSKRGAPIWEGSAEQATSHGMPAPHAIPVRVTDKRGAGLAGVELWQSVPGNTVGLWRRSSEPTTLEPQRLLAITDASGQATVAPALRVEGGRVCTPFLLHARVNGFSHGRAGILVGGQSAGPFSGHLPIKVPADHVLPMELLRPQPLRVEPAGVYHVTVLGKALRSQTAPNERPTLVKTDERGHGWLPLPPGRDRARVGRVERKSQAPFWCVLTQGPTGYDIDTAVSTVRIQVLDKGGRPAREAPLSVIPMHRHLHLPGFPLPLHLDVAGRATANLHVGTSWLLWSRIGDDLAWHVVREGMGGVADVVLTLAPMPRITVHLVDTQGIPIADQPVAWGGSTSLARANASDRDRLLAGRHMGLLPKGMQQSNERGELWLPLLPIEGAHMDLQLSTQYGQRGSVTLHSGDKKTVTLR